MPRKSITTRRSPTRALRVVADEAGDSLRLRVAFATCRRRRHAIQPFGAADAFMIYDVTPTASHFVKVIVFAPAIRGRAKADDDKLSCEMRRDARFEALTGCQLVFVRRIGVSATMAAISRQIPVMEVAFGQSIPAALARCQETLAANAPSWLRKLTKADGPEADEVSAAFSHESAKLGSAL